MPVSYLKSLKVRDTGNLPVALRTDHILMCKLGPTVSHLEMKITIADLPHIFNSQVKQ